MRTARLVVLALLVGAFASSSAYALPTVTVTWDPNHSPSGGEFILATSDAGTFNSFCLEVDEFISVGGTYYYTTSDEAILGGANTDAGDPISAGTAWLYSQFAAGTLAGYTGTTLQQTQLQNAIWGLEGEITYDSSNVWIALALATLGLTDLQLQADANGAYGVYAMNLWANADGTGAAQSMLGVPDGGLTVTLLGLGLGGLALLRRKLS